MADTDTFDDRFGAATAGATRLSDDDIDYLFGRPKPSALTKEGPVKNPAGDIVHPSIPGIHSVETSGGPEGFPGGLWGGAANAVQNSAIGDWWKRATTPYRVPPMPDVSGPGDILRDLTVGRDNPVENASPMPDKGHLSAPPVRADGPAGPDMPLPAPPPPAPPAFGAGAQPPMVPPQTGSPTFQTMQRPQLPPQAPPPAAPPPAATPAAAPPGAPPAGVGASPGGSPQVPPKDTNLLPPGSLADIMHKWTSWRDENRLMLLAMAGGLAGSQSIGQGIGRAFSAAVPAAQADMARGNANSTADLLMQKIPGLTQQQALAMARNPTIMQQIVPQMFGAKQRKFTVIGENSLTGQKTYGFVDEVSGKVYDMAGNEVGHGGAGGIGGTGDAGNMPENYDPQTGRDEKFLQALDPVSRRAVEGILSGDASAAGRNMQKYLPLAMRAEQGFSQPTYDERKRTMADFAPQGTSGKNLTAINTGLNHLDRLNSMVDQLDKYNFARASLINTPMNMVRGQLSPEYQDFEGHWNAAVNGVAGEMAKVFRSTGMSERDIDEWRKSFDINSSPPKAKAAIQEAMHLIDGRLDAIGESYNKGMRLSSTKPSLELLSPQAQKIHEKISGGGQDTRMPVTSQTVPPANERKVGEVYVTPKGPMMWMGNGWQPAR